MLAKVRQFLRDDEGPTAVEYAVMLALIVVLCWNTVWAVGVRSSFTFLTISSRAGS
ncbi:MAG: Flp family type IVb pilin [Planctomycetia bacterium]|nr:Flp family type IVb pilin [Planctomycetia bacterium]